MSETLLMDSQMQIKFPLKINENRFNYFCTEVYTRDALQFHDLNKPLLGLWIFLTCWSEIHRVITSPLNQID